MLKAEVKGGKVISGQQPFLGKRGLGWWKRLQCSPMEIDNTMVQSTYQRRQKKKGNTTKWCTSIGY